MGTIRDELQTRKHTAEVSRIDAELLDFARRMTVSDSTARKALLKSTEHLFNRLRQIAANLRYNLSESKLIENAFCNYEAGLQGLVVEHIHDFVSEEGMP